MGSPHPTSRVPDAAHLPSRVRELPERAELTSRVPSLLGLPLPAGDVPPLPSCGDVAVYEEEEGSRQSL